MIALVTGVQTCALPILRMRIAAEVARAWFEATGTREELRAQRATVATLHQTLELMRGRAALGDVAGADVDATHERWAAANALLPGIEARQRAAVLGRSEEHTSELQSLMRISYAVFCLKKKNKKSQTSQIDSETR